jgi:hypothetical protein
MADPYCVSEGHTPVYVNPANAAFTKTAMEMSNFEAKYCKSI